MVPKQLAHILPDWADKQHSPFCAYIYDLASLRTHVKHLVSKLPANCELFYAIKANSELPILSTLASIMHGFEVASEGEIKHVRSSFPNIPLIFGGPGKHDGELETALSSNVEMIHVESISELERLSWIAKKSGHVVDVLLRVNMPLPNDMSSTLAMGGKATQFGIDSKDVFVAVEQARKQSSIRLRGLHFHLLSHQKSASMHLKLMEKIHGFFQEIVREFDSKSPCILNAGGGFGIEYLPPFNHFDWNEFCSGLNELLQSGPIKNHRIRFEAGRYITAQCGYYVTEVIDIKENLGEKFVVCRGGTQHFRTPVAQGHSHPFEIIQISKWEKPYQRLETRDCNITISGQLCTPKDILAKEAPIQLIRMGDLVAFPLAGAYAWHISPHDFLKHPAPTQIFLSA